MTTLDRVRNRTAADANRAIRERTEGILDAIRSSPEAIRLRLETLDREWNVDQVVGVTSAALSLYGLMRGRAWLLVPFAAQVFNVQQAVLGWSPILPFLRRRGLRTQREIERERYALRALLREGVDDGQSDRQAESPRRPPEPYSDPSDPGR